MESKKCINNILLVGLAFVYILLFSPYTTPLNAYYGYDTALWNVIGRGIAEGKVPYLDLFDHKGPILFGIYGLAWLFPNPRMALYLLQSISFSIVLISLFYLLKIYLTKTKAWIVMGLFLVMFCGTIGEGAMSEEWCLPFITVSLYLAFRFLISGAGAHPVRYGLFYGIAFGVTSMIRLNNAVPIAAIVLAFIVILLRKKQFHDIWTNAIAFVSGIVIVLVPSVIWYMGKNALPDMIEGAFLFNFRYAVADAVSPGEELKKWLMIVPAVLGILFIIKSKEIEIETDIKIFVVMVVGCSALSMTLGHAYMHYYTIVLPAWSILFALLLKAPLKKKWVAVLGVLVLMLPFIWPSARNVGKSILLNTKSWYTKQHEEIKEFMSQIPDSERDSVWGNGSSFSKVYCVAEIVPCYKYFDNSYIQFPVNQNMENETREMLLNHPPKWIVVATVGETRISALEELIPQKYELVDTLQGEKYLELYHLIDKD